MKRLYNRSLSTLVGLLLPSLCAAETVYDVELIVFANRQADSGEEYWPRAESGTEWQRAFVPGQVEALEPVQPEEPVLGPVAYSLRRSSHYQPLLHYSWRQPGWGRDSALPVRVAVPFSADLPLTTAALPTLEPGQRQPGTPVDEPQPTPPPRSQTSGILMLEGTLKVYKARYLHLAADLILRDRLNPDSRPGGMLPPSYDELYRDYRLQQSRRMRSEELHYLDHPRMGVLVHVTPVEVPDQAEEEGQAAESAPAEQDVEDTPPPSGPAREPTPAQ